ncbi:TPA: substrate-binding domain-containing protein [Salmonella enterica]|nr:substrate-binding domain-containing protein [Salmonella enterica]
MNTSTFSSVCIDDEEATYFIVKKPIETGKKKIALINHDTKLSYAKKRQLGFERALSEGNINSNNIVYVKAHLFHDGAEALAEICSKSSMPDAIIAASDILAVGAMHQEKKWALIYLRNFQLSDLIIYQLQKCCRPNLAPYINLQKK